ncbi:MAG: hypothetical protein HKN87_13245 [Saprospiraceae bacterium]|nr:hypothetical protein [Saprospiraceae bacterium]
MLKIRQIDFYLLIFCALVLNLRAQNDPLDIGSRLELFVDDHLIDQLNGDAIARMHHPIAREVVIRHDKPWEGSGSGYHSIFHDGEKYRMYYKSWQHTASSDSSNQHPLFCAYATSMDGIHWEKPNLGLYKFQGSKDNNIVFIRGMMDGVDADGGHPAVWKDERPDVPQDGRFKALLRSNGEPGLFAFKSPDGIHWTSMSQKPVITEGAFDSQNLAFWDPNIKAYRAYWRFFSEGTKDDIYAGIRGIRTAISDDLIHWRSIQDLDYFDAAEEQLNTNQIKPYFRAPHILLGFPARYIDRGWSHPMRSLPELVEREDRSAISPRYGTALTETLFMASRNGTHFKRWEEAFIRPGIERDGTWTYGDSYVAWQILETDSAIKGAPRELSIYASENYWKGQASALRRYTLRMDGFVSISASMKGGTLTTKPFSFSGLSLILNFATSAAGSIHVEILDESGKPLVGFGLEDCPPIFGDAIERMVTWSSEKRLDDLQGRLIRLRFTLRDADLFSFRFK